MENNKDDARAAALADLDSQLEQKLKIAENIVKNFEEEKLKSQTALLPEQLLEIERLKQLIKSEGHSHGFGGAGGGGHEHDCCDHEHDEEDDEDEEACHGGHGHSHAGGAGGHGHGHSHGGGGGGHGHDCSAHGHSHGGGGGGHGHSHGGHGHSHDHGSCGGVHGYDEYFNMLPNHFVSESTKFFDKSQYVVADEFELEGVRYVQYKDESQMPMIMNLMAKDLSEPYSVYTYRYFIHNWPNLCFLAMDKEECVGAIVCKLDRYKDVLRGYIAMLDVNENYRRKKVGSNLVTTAIKRMVFLDADEVVLETEVTNAAALRLYEKLGFVRDKRLFRYYLNGVEAYRLKLWFK